MRKFASPSYVEATLRASPSSGQALSAPPSQAICLQLKGTVIHITALLTVTVSGLRLHPEVPLVVLLDLMHLGISFSLLIFGRALSSFILGRACSRDDGGIDLINSASCSISLSRRYLVEHRLDPWPIAACLKGLWLTDSRDGQGDGQGADGAGGPAPSAPAASQSLAALIAGISTAFTPEKRF